MSEEDTSVGGLLFWTPIGMSKGSVPFYPRPEETEAAVDENDITAGQFLQYLHGGVFIPADVAGSGGIYVTSEYRLTTGGDTTPNSGRASYLTGFGDVPIGDPMTLYFNAVDVNGLDQTAALFAQIAIGDRLYIQVANNSFVYQSWEITGFTDNATHYDMVLQMKESEGTFRNNDTVLCYWHDLT